MPQHIGYIALLIRDYDEAISYFIEKLGFTVAEDTDLGGGKRWVLVAPPGSVETRDISCALRLRRSVVSLIPYPPIKQAADVTAWI
jgi:catechol 2,3-dioxygenase-like lactoylglutathione lyase family enzyme